MGAVGVFRRPRRRWDKVAWALPARNISVYFVWGEWQNILIFVGGAHATAAAGIVFKLAIEGRLKTGISGLLSRNPCFQTTLVTSRKVVWALPARNLSVYSVFGRWAKYPDFRGRSPRYGCVRWFIQTRNRRSSENGHNGFAWLQSVVSDDLDEDGTR